MKPQTSWNLQSSLFKFDYICRLLAVKRYTPMIPDPVSYIDGIHTFLEVYTDGKTVPESSPPCPRVDRFCIASAHTDLSTDIGSNPAPSSSSASSGDKSGGNSYVRRQFLVRAPRLVVRLIVAKPSKPPIDVEMDAEHMGVMENGVDPFESEEPLDIFSVLPNFTFTLTALSPRISGGKFIYGSINFLILLACLLII